MVARSAAFLDRDGVLVRSLLRYGKPHAPTCFEDFEILPGSEKAVDLLRQAGFLLVLATNQPDVGNGLVSREEVERMNEALDRALNLDAIKVCFHGQHEGCDCRKPLPGMLLDAAREMSIDLNRSYMVGDRRSDVEAGHAAGCRTVFIDQGYDRPEKILPDFTVGSVVEAAEVITRNGGTLQ